MTERKVIGLIEEVEIKGRKVKAKIDTGAERSSIDLLLASEIEVGPIIGTKKYRNSLGKGVKRPLVEAEIILHDTKMTTKFNLADRSGLNFKILIGRDILQQGKFLVDPLL